MQIKWEQITSKALAGNLLGDSATRRVNILLPPGYAASDKRYPVLYAVPGGNGHPCDNTYGFKYALESLLRTGEAREMIVVVPDASNKLGASLFRSSPTIGDYEGFVTRELVDYVDKNYRTLATTNSRGLAGCSNRARISTRLALKYPDTFSVVAASSSGSYSDVPWQSDLDTVRSMTALPQAPDDVNWDVFGPIQYYLQAAAGIVANPDKPPFYLDMPFQIVDGHGEFVPEVLQKIADQEDMHEAQRYAQQPNRLRGILLLHGTNDATTELTKDARDFAQLLTQLGIDHKYVENSGGLCDCPWEAESLKFMSGLLDFQAPPVEARAGGRL